MNDAETKQLDRIEKKVDDGFRRMNGRVRRLEIWKGFITGALAVLGVVIGFILKGL